MITPATLRTVLARYISEQDSLQEAFDHPETDLFTLGLDSMGAFALLDDLAVEGITVEFTDLIANPTVSFLTGSTR